MHTKKSTCTTTYELKSATDLIEGWFIKFLTEQLKLTWLEIIL